MRATLRGTRGIALIAAAAFAALLLALVPSTAGAAKKPEKGPSGLAFYDPPKQLPKGHGKLIWYTKSGGLVPLDNAAVNDNVLYTSKSPQGDQVAVSGSISLPEGKPPKGGWPVITWAHGTTGVADVCAPSRNALGDPAAAYISYVNPILSEWLAAGYAVLRTDYQGLGTPGKAPYLIGKSEGRSTLDIIRAARQLEPSLSEKYVIAGHSQGGHAALFAAGNAEKWTPELQLEGTMSYAPASHLYQQALALPSLTQPSGLSALATTIVYGATTANPRVDAQQLLSDAPLQFYPELEQTCLPQLGAPNKLGGIAPAALLREGANTNALYKVLKKNNPDVQTSAPILVLQGESDTTVFPFLTDSLVGELNQSGDTTDYQKYPGVDHGSIVSAAEPQAMDFLEQHLPSGN